jgi:transposase
MLKESYYTEPTEIDQLVFEKLVPPEHYLRQVKRCIDFERCRDLVKDCYSPAMGRTAEDPVRMIKLAFLQFHDNLSDRDVIATAQVNVAFRFFLDLSLESRLPVPSLLAQFRTRVGVERHQALFDQIVTQAREYGLIRDRLRLKDATHILANIAVPSTLRLVAQTRQRLLEAARPYAPERVAAEEAEAEAVRQATADLPETDRLVTRVTHLRAIVAWADEVQQALEPVSMPPAPVRTRFEAALTLAHRILADRDEPDKGDQVRRVVDPDARCGKHGASFDGSLLDISLDADSARLTALTILPGNGDEARDTQTLLEAEERAQGNDVEAVSIDGIGWNGEVLRALSAPEGVGVEVYVPPPPAPEETSLFGPEAFVLDAQREVVTCPGGQQTATKARNAHNTGWKFVFARRQCAACPLQARCMAQPPKGKGRSVIKNDYQAEYAAARARAKTPGYAAVRQQHPRVERKLADIVRYHDGRRSRYRGQWRVQVQYLLTGLVVNVKRMVKLLRPQGAQPAWQPV